VWQVRRSWAAGVAIKLLVADRLVLVHRDILSALYALIYASMLFSTSSAVALSGLLYDSAMMVIAFQSSPILSLPRARGRVFKLAFVIASVWVSHVIASGRARMEK